MKGVAPGESIIDSPSPYTPEQVFIRLSRVLERELFTDKDMRPSSQRIVASVKRIMRTAPTFFIDMPEVKRISDWCRENPADLSIDPLPVFPFEEMVVANPYSAVLIFDSEDRVKSQDVDGWEVVSGLPATWRCKYVMLQQEDDRWMLAIGDAQLGQPQNNGRTILLPHCTLAFANTAEGEADSHTNFTRMKEFEYPYYQKVRGAIGQVISMALDTCRYLDAPRHHLVVEEPRAFNPADKKPKVPRAHERPRVRLVEPEKVRLIYPHQPGGDATTTGEGRTVTPHMRRGHTKVLSSPRYKAARGRKIVIRPTWVGDPEWEHGGVKYRVVYRPPAAPIT